MEADPAFGSLVSRAFDFELAPLVSHGATVLLWAWLAAGVLRVLCRTADTPSAAGARRGGRLGLGEVGTVLVVVDLLFAAFVVVQFRYLFGGNDLVRELTGHELRRVRAARASSSWWRWRRSPCRCSWSADRWLDQPDPRRVRRFRQLAGVMLLLLDIMLASALLRMWLYTTQFGLTEQRFYTTAFMGWLVLVFGWFVATVLRGRRERFGMGALAAGWLVLAALNLVNPDALIAGVNFARAARGGRWTWPTPPGSVRMRCPPSTGGCRGSARTRPARRPAGWRAVADRAGRGGRWTIALARAPRGADRLRRRAACGLGAWPSASPSPRSVGAGSGRRGARRAPRAPRRRPGGNPPAASPALPASVIRSRHEWPWCTTASRPRARDRSSQAASTVRPKVAPVSRRRPAAPPPGMPETARRGSGRTRPGWSRRVRPSRASRGTGCTGARWNGSASRRRGRPRRVAADHRGVTEVGADERGALQHGILQRGELEGGAEGIGAVGRVRASVAARSLASVSRASVRSASVQSAEVRSAPSSRAWRRSAPVSRALQRSAPRRSAPRGPPRPGRRPGRASPASDAPASVSAAVRQRTVSESRARISSMAISRSGSRRERAGSPSIRPRAGRSNPGVEPFAVFCTRRQSAFP